MNKSKVLKIAASSVAAVALGGALVYYNFIADQSVTTLKVWDAAPDFTMQTYVSEDGALKTGGEEFTLSKQDKVTVLNFWATWCGPCKAEMPYFSELQKNYADYVDVMIVSGEVSKGGYEGLGEWMSGQEGAGSYEKWADYAFTYGFYDVNTLDVYSAYGFSGALPSTAIVDSEGIVRFLKEGSMTYAELEAELLKVLPEGVESTNPSTPTVPTTKEKNWWKENALGVAFLAVATAALGTAIVVSVVSTVQDKKKKTK